MFQVFMDHLDLSELDQVKDQLEHKLDGLLQKAGETAEKEAVSRAAVRTGRMRDSITNEESYLMSTTYTNVYYSYFVELGTYKMQAQPFMIPAFEIARDQLLQDLKSL